MPSSLRKNYADVIRRLLKIALKKFFSNSLSPACGLPVHFWVIHEAGPLNVFIFMASLKASQAKGRAASTSTV